MLPDDDPLDTDDDDDVDDDGTLTKRAGLDFEIEDLAAALQLSRHVEPELTDEAEIEEIDAIADPPEEPTHPRRLYLLIDGHAHVVAKDRFVIGRVSAQCDLAIIDANVSRQHCAIERKDGIFFVTDLGSTNGVEIDGMRVDDHPIDNGDVLVLSGHRIVCSFEPPVVEAVLPPLLVEAPRLARPTDVTGPLPVVPPAIEHEHDHEAIELEPDHELHDAPAAFEARVELRLAALAEDITALRVAMEKLVGHVESLKGVDALAQLIQRRVQERKRER